MDSLRPIFPRRRRTAGSFADAGELAQDEIMRGIRDQGGLGVEQIVDIVGDFVWIDAADIEEAVVIGSTAVMRRPAPARRSDWRRPRPKA